jgi:hypothetical protein
MSAKLAMSKRTGKDVPVIAAPASSMPIAIKIKSCRNIVAFSYIIERRPAHFSGIQA